MTVAQYKGNFQKNFDNRMRSLEIRITTHYKSSNDHRIRKRNTKL